MSTNPPKDVVEVASHGLFGFLWDFRERQVNHLSFWYGFLQCLAMVWVMRWIWEGTGFQWWRVPMVMTVAIAAKWCQHRHALRCDPNADGLGRRTLDAESK